jgi:enoyl-CoA hydratase/carnithine racemase
MTASLFVLDHGRRDGGSGEARRDRGHGMAPVVVDPTARGPHGVAATPLRVETCSARLIHAQSTLGSRSAHGGAGRSPSRTIRHMPDSHLKVDRPRDGVVLLTLDNPDQRNAMTGPMTDAWRRTTAELAAAPGLRAVVVTGAGSAFCSGGDMAWIGSEPGASVSDLRQRMLPFYRAWLSVLDLEVPTIAAVNGAAIGAGLCLALACDLRFAADDARLAAPFVRLGMHPAMAATWLLPDVVGAAHARDLLLTGRAVDAEEALRAASEIAATAPVASRLTTRALRAGHADLEAAILWEALAQPVTLATADLREGLEAARGRRAPRFTGR